MGIGGVAPARAVTVTVQMQGTWTTVSDTARVLDGSVQTGSLFSIILIYDDQTPDSNTSPLLGAYGVDTSALGLTFATGNYSFRSHGPTAASGFNGIVIQNGATSDSVGVFFDAFTAIGVFPLGVSIDPSGYSDIGVNGPTSVLSSTALDASIWNFFLSHSNDFTFFAPVTNRGALDHIQLGGSISNFSISTPEPGASLLALATLFALVALRRGFL